jgi:hypothetical protein
MATSAGFREEIQVLEQTLSRFIPALIPVHQLDATMPEDKHILIVTHTLAHAAMIHLYHRFAEEDPISYNKRLRAARGCVTIIKHITDGDFDFLDPIIGVRIPVPRSRLVTHLSLFSYSPVGHAPWRP